MRRFLTALAVAGLTACGGNTSDINAIETPSTTTSAAPTTTAVKTVRQWALPSLPYVEEIQNAFDDIAKVSKTLDLDAARAGAQRLADASRGFRLALESSGPAPPAAAVQGPAVIEATRDLEQKSRVLAACVSISDCTVAVRSETVAFQSWGSAVEALTEVINS